MLVIMCVCLNLDFDIDPDLDIQQKSRNGIFDIVDMIKSIFQTYQNI